MQECSPSHLAVRPIRVDAVSKRIWRQIEFKAGTLTLARGTNRFGGNAREWKFEVPLLVTRSFNYDYACPAPAVSSAILHSISGTALSCKSSSSFSLRIC